MKVHDAVKIVSDINVDLKSLNAWGSSADNCPSECDCKNYLKLGRKQIRDVAYVKIRKGD